MYMHLKQDTKRGENASYIVSAFSLINRYQEIYLHCTDEHGQCEAGQRCPDAYSDTQASDTGYDTGFSPPTYTVENAMDHTPAVPGLGASQVDPSPFDPGLFSDRNLSTATLVQEGSSVWCTGSDHTQRICRFRNLCYFPEVNEFVFFHSQQSVYSGVPSNRFNPTLLDMSSVRDHNAQYFNFFDVPARSAVHFEVDFIQRPSLIFNRFNPDNIMHVIHDDLLPMFHTLEMITGRNNINMSAFDVQLVFMEGWSPGDHVNLYEVFAVHKLLFKTDLQAKGSVTCFRNAYTGISKETTWYQYGFREPQGPIPHHTVTALQINQFTAYLKYRLNTSTMPVPNGNSYIVFFTRKHNRLVLNEVELTFALVREFKMKVLSVGAETHSIAEMIAILSKATVLISMHGSLLSLSMFLPPSAIVIELFPYAVNPENYTPYKTLAHLPGMRITYKAWRNMNEANTVTHPDRSWDTGGIAHLSSAEQNRIKSSTEVPKHICCRDPEWLFRIYQDTIVDIPSLISLVKEAIEENDMRYNEASERTGSLLVQKMYPSKVQDLKCIGSRDRADAMGNPDRSVPPSLWLSWQPPWNLRYLTLTSLRYEVWIQEHGEDAYTAWILSKTSHTFTAGLRPETHYDIWVRCVINDNMQGPFNQEHVSCHT